MKVVILAGGFGTRLAEETHSIPKPMVEIGGKPILWHIMKIYSTYGFNDFVICLGYKGYVIKEYFANYFLHNSDVTIDIKNNSMEIHNNYSEPWKVTLVDTGLNTMTGGRLKRVAKYLDDETFMLTYGDGVGNINIKELIEFHRSHGKLATVTATQPEGRFGALKLENNKVTSFAEKMDNKDSWINGGFFVLEPEVINYIKDDNTIWEREPLEKLSKDGELMAYFHDGFWKPMDKLKDKMDLEEMWNSGNAPWKIWGE
ncbi:MAG: glucose-phosphate cytidylyltransferase [Methanothermococcus sp.]|uniref:glucose-1-phosphate cytidylyltransferase n=1 Tax=Methanothermococcus sp. TaxID=2614238 RepID=UPI002589D31E|nr:glucose-1-phosphate cytidylyltransferase [Methanothermococcus sp.]MDK2789589.1 glucose-phosphate cytidylyltransferase [Methanothermococcus sp.]